MNDKKYERYYGLASRASFENWNSVKESHMCGCYYCGHIFPSSQVTDADWVPDRHGRTVTCPYCGIDSVIGDTAGIPIQEDVLQELYEYWFGVDEEEEKARRCVVADDCEDILTRLENLGMEAITHASPNNALSRFIPDCFCFSGPTRDHKSMAAELKVYGTTVIWRLSPVWAEDDMECVKLSDVILVSGGDLTDTRLADATNDKLFVRTLGKHGLLFRFRDRAWKTLRMNSNEDVDFDAAEGWIAAGIIDSLARTGKTIDTLENMEAERILIDAMKFAVEATRAAAH